MKKEVKKFFKKVFITLIPIIIIATFCTIIYERPTSADSGFSTSHSSSHSSSSSSHSSSHSSSSHSSSYSGDSSSSGESSLVSFIVFVIIIIIYILIAVSSKNKTTKSTQKISNMDDSKIEELIKVKIPNFDKYKFLKQGFDIYYKVQEAWMNFKLEDVRANLTDELYNMYESQLTTLEVKGEQNIMKDMVMRYSFLKDVSVQNNNITITTGYIIEQYDYIADINTGKLIRGEANKKMRVEYEMKFRKALDENSTIDKCPNCGAKVDINSGGVCEYCGSKIVSDNSEWVLTEKKALSQNYI